MTENICPQCARDLKLTTASKLTDTMPYVWKCACGLYATEKDEDYQKRISTTHMTPEKETPTPKTVEEVIEQFNPDHNNSVLGEYILAYENAKAGFGILEEENKRADEKINNWLRTTLTAQNQAADERLREVVKAILNGLDENNYDHGWIVAKIKNAIAKHGITNL